MSICIRAVACALAVAFAGFASEAASRDSGAYYDWSEQVSELPSTWGDYFRRNAKVSLGPERRLRNGVAWRLFVDEVTGVPVPRVTWRPNGERLRVANRLLETVHGGEMLVVEHERGRLRKFGERRIAEGFRFFDVPAVTEWDVDLTYVGERLLSMVASAGVWGEGKGSSRALFRGLTFDLRTEKVVHLSECPGMEGLYGVAPEVSVPVPAERFFFRYGELFHLCNAARYRDFIALVKRVEARSGYDHLSASASDLTRRCIELQQNPVFQERQEYVLYLTFTGLAVQASGHGCPPRRTPDNPVIVPYRELAPFMQPGPWRDELLSLR